MRESHLRGVVLSLLREAGLHAMAVENSACPGTPDVEYGGEATLEYATGSILQETRAGWIELKQLARLPVRAETPLRIPKFRREQRIWLDQRWRSGGEAHLLLVAGTDWILWDGKQAADLGRAPVPLSDALTLARDRWTRKPSHVAFLDALRR